MSAAHPIIGVTGASGAGTSTALKVLLEITRALEVTPVVIEGDAFHAYDRQQVREALERARIRGENFSLFGPAGNLLERLETCLQEYGENGTGKIRRYLHTEAEAEQAGQPSGTFTPWERIPRGSDLLIYEGLHGGYAGDDVDIARHMDLLIGVTPVINLEWIQKIRRDTDERGHRPEDVMSTILRRMPDYVTHITPQFSRTDINFQRVPLVDTSNPFTVRDIPPPEESLVVAHFSATGRIRPDVDALQRDLQGAFVSHPQTLVIPGTLISEAMRRILTPAVEALIANIPKGSES
jgi:phosphoribulokinase